jgi:RHS repeat-associated protein
MQLASGSHIPDGLLAANALLSEKLHQGFAAPKSTLHQGFEVAISSTPLGIKRSLYDGRVRSRCTGKERDAESGLDYFGARYYASSMGRFMSPDPLMATPERLLDPQEWNMYGYARNNPLSITDPTGLDIWLQGCGANSSTCQGNYVGTTDDNGNFSRTHLTGDQTGDATLGTNGISVTQGGNTYQGVWDSNAGEQGAVQVAGGGDLSSFNANITGNCQGTCVASGSITNKDGSPAAAGDVRAALTNPDGSAKSGWFGNNNDPFHRSPNGNGKNVNDTSFNAMNPDVAGQRSTDVTVPQNPGLGVKMHVNSGYPFEDAYQMTRHVISIMHTFLNTAGITHPTTQ